MAKSRRMRHRRSRRGGYEETTKNTNEESGVLNPDTDNERIGLAALGYGGKRRHKTRGRGRRSRRGGAGAADWVISNFGATPEFQFQNTFGNGGNGHTGALIPTVTGAPAVLPNNVPQGSLAQYAAPVQGGGKRRRKKGGYWAQVIETALVPFGLLGLQNAYGKRTRKHHRK